MIYFLLMIEVFLLLLALKFEKGDILAPSVIVCMVWILSTLCAVYNIDNWQIQMHFNTVFSILLGLSVFIFTAELYSILPKVKIVNNKRKKTTNLFYNKSKVMNIFLPALILMIALNTITIYMQYRWLVSISGNLSTWIEMMADYRNTSSTWSTDSITKSSLLSNLESLLKASAYVTSYVGINNLVLKKVGFKEILCFVPGALYIIDRLLNAGRGDILLYFAAVALCIYISLQKKYNWTKKISKKFVRVLLIGIVSVLALFSSARSLVGRLNTLDTMDYITYYVGGSVQNFDLFMQDTVKDVHLFGEETFSTLINYLGKTFNIQDWIYIHHLEFRVYHGISTGNVYGAFRYYIYDFGYIGLIILTAIVAVFYSVQYCSIKKDMHIQQDGFSWKMFIYILWAPSLFMFSIAEYTYSMVLNIVGNIRFFIFAWIIKYIIIDIAFQNSRIYYKKIFKS